MSDGIEFLCNNRFIKIIKNDNIFLIDNEQISNEVMKNCTTEIYNCCINSIVQFSFDDFNELITSIKLSEKKNFAFSSLNSIANEFINLILLEQMNINEYIFIYINENYNILNLYIWDEYDCPNEQYELIRESIEDRIFDKTVKLIFEQIICKELL